MKRISGVLFAAVFLFTSTCVSAAVVPDGPPPGTLVRDKTYSPDKLLVKFRSGASAAQIQAALNTHGALSAQSFRHSARIASGPIDQWRIVQLGRGADLANIRTALMRNPLVIRVEYNYQVRIALTPDDPSFNQLWGLNNIGQTGGVPDADVDAPEAWDQTTGDPSVVVAVIDTGVAYDHPDLAANMWINTGEIPGNGIDDDGNGYVDDVYGYDFSNNDSNPYDDHGHGTHVSGTIAAVGNNGVGITGVTWRARIMAVKFLNASGSGSTDGAINAILYAASNGAKVLNNSWGGGGFSQALLDAIQASDQAGALFIAAAGNSNTNNDVTPHYPSSYEVPNVIAGAATDHGDLKASFSSYGATTVDLGAPGVSIYSTVPVAGHSCCSNATGYSNLSGTSMATPHVSGAAALLLARFPGSSHLAIRDRILNTADPIPSMGGITVTGARLNVVNAMEVDTVVPAAVSDLATNLVGAYSVTLRWTATGDDGFSGNAGSYDLRYSLNPINDTNFAQATAAIGTPVPSAPGTLESFKVSGLVPNTDYYFALRVRDNVGNFSGLSNVVSARTKTTLIRFQDNMESGSSNWTVAGSDGVGGPALWHLSTHRSNSPTTAFYYGKPTTFTFNTGARNFGSITSVPIDLSNMTDAWLSFAHFLQTENLSPFDTARVQVSNDNGVTWVDKYVTALSTGSMVTRQVDLSAYDGQTIRIRFSFDTVDSVLNDFEGWVLDDVALTVAQTNGPPIANAGGPYSGYRNTPVVFNGGGSSDPDNNPLTYAWDFGDGTNGSGATPSHSYANAGNYTVTLVVSDGTLTSAPASTNVTIVNRAPVANAGGPYNGYRNQAIAFNGSGSSDADGDALTYVWTFGDGTTGSGATPAHPYTASGNYTVSLVVNDGFVDSASVTTTVTIQNRAPTANAGGPYTGYRNTPISFAGTGTDPDGDALSFGWSFGDGSTGTGPTPTHNYTALGNYSVVLVTNDGEIGSAPATTGVTIVNRLPVANAGPDQTVRRETTVQLNGTGSSDLDGTITSYRWRQVSGTSVRLRNASSAIANFRAPEPRGSTPLTLVFELRVTDNNGGSAVDLVTITVTR